jgi:hypothetical protein
VGLVGRAEGGPRSAKIGGWPDQIFTLDPAFGNVFTVTISNIAYKIPNAEIPPFPE